MTDRPRILRILADYVELGNPPAFVKVGVATEAWQAWRGRNIAIAFLASQGTASVTIWRTGDSDADDPVGSAHDDCRVLQR